MLLSFRIAEGMFLNVMSSSYPSAMSYLRKKKGQKHKSIYCKYEVLWNRQNVLLCEDIYVQVMSLFISNIFC